MAVPEVVTPEKWLDARLRLLAQENELTRRRDALSAGRRRLPMVRATKEYLLEGPQGPAALGRPEPWEEPGDRVPASAE